MGVLALVFRVNLFMTNQEKEVPSAPPIFINGKLEACLMDRYVSPLDSHFYSSPANL